MTAALGPLQMPVHALLALLLLPKMVRAGLMLLAGPMPLHCCCYRRRRRALGSSRVLTLLTGAACRQAGCPPCWLCG